MSHETDSVETAMQSHSRLAAYTDDELIAEFQTRYSSFVFLGMTDADANGRAVVAQRSCGEPLALFQLVYDFTETIKSEL